MYVGDITIMIEHIDAESAALILSIITDKLVRAIEEELSMEISPTKTLVNASRMAIANRTAFLSQTQRLTAQRACKLLGAGAAGGRRRCMVFLRARLKPMRQRVQRIHAVRAAGLQVANMVRAAITQGVTYGAEIMGVSDSLLEKWRVMVAGAVSPEAGGKNCDLVLYLRDGNKGTLDPAFDAHVKPIRM